MYTMYCFFVCHRFQIPTAWLSLFDVIFLLVLLPLMDRLVYPALNRRGWILNIRKRIVIGQYSTVTSVFL